MSTFAEVLGRRPELAAKHDHLLALATDGRVDAGLVRLCEQRIGTLLGCREHGAPAPSWDSMPTGHQACVDFAERFVLDPKGIDDDLAARVVAHLGDAGMVAFTTALALFEGRCRMERMFATAAAAGGR